MPEEAASRWWPRFAGLVSLELIGVIVIMFFAGRLTALEPSRSVLAKQENQQNIAFQLNDRAANLCDRGLLRPQSLPVSRSTATLLTPRPKPRCC